MSCCPTFILVFVLYIAFLMSLYKTIHCLLLHVKRMVHHKRQEVSKLCPVMQSGPLVLSAIVLKDPRTRL
jgi:hypothetical protein